MRGGWAHGPGGTVKDDQGEREIEVREIAGARCQRGFGGDAGVVVSQQDADVVGAEAGVAGLEHRCFCAAQGGEQEKEAGEMAWAEFHGG